MTVEENPPVEFSLVDSILENGLTVEASAGSGKTYSVAGAVSLLLAKQGDLRISEILVTTFTRNAAAELRDRIRRQLISLERALRNGNISDDDVLAKSLDGPDRLVYADRLDRAIREFDSAIISTIHSVCSRVMAMAGLPVVGEGRSESDIENLIENVVNSVVVSYVVKLKKSDLENHVIVKNLHRFSSRLKTVVTQVLGSPRSLLSVSGTTDESGDEFSTDVGEQTRFMVRQCVNKIVELTRSDPTFNDLLLRTADVLGPQGDQAVSDTFRQRFKVAVIDEAQDTDQLQWEIFRSAFEADEIERKLVTVGDPKQAIYRFRGADVEAYLANRDESKVQTLTKNWRSDARLVRALNAVFDGETFGDGISYYSATPRPGAPESSINDFPSLTILDIGEQTTSPAVTFPAAVRVVELLGTVKIHEDGNTRNLRPQDVCVLVTSRTNGRKIESALRQFHVPAVSSGTESVMEGVMAADLRRLFRAMDAPSDESLLKLAAATIFLGAQIVELGAISDADLAKYGQTLAVWSSVLRRKGVNALANQLRRDENVLRRLVSGRNGERHETDFAHIFELLHKETKGRGCSSGAVLEAFDRLKSLDATTETVSRRVESDRDAVQIMTVHASKGLEFPVVVVADLWKEESRGKSSAPVFHSTIGVDNESRHRVIDIGWVLDRKSTTVRTIKKAEELGEKKRLFYVAMTRAKHHVTLIYAQKPRIEVEPKGKKKKSSSSDVRLTDSILQRTKDVCDGICVELLTYNKPQNLSPYPHGQESDDELQVSEIHRDIVTTYRRLSFSGITKNQRGESTSPVAEVESTGGGAGDDDDVITIRSGYSDESIEPGVSSMPMGRVPGGTYFGTVIHRVYELVDFAAEDIRSEVERVVDEVVVGSLAGHREEIIDGVLLSLETPLGGLLGSVQLRDISRQDRLDELGFEMGLADVDAKVSISEIGTVVKKYLTEAGRPDDLLMNYLSGLEKSFNTQLVGLMNGSIDALLRVQVGEEQRFFITDYKTNRLDRDGVDTMIDGYSRDSMLEEMEHHDYPLQALIYGVGVYRFLRWARPDIDADATIAGFSYFFVRGMVGSETPIDGQHRHGVFSWEAPAGLWPALSDLFSRGAVAS
jgi:exodeoxyribonuclease V beta subunit